MKSVWQDLVTAMLAIYNYNLEKIDGISEGLEAQGLFNPNQLAKFQHEGMYNALKKAGFNRGDLTAIFIDRLLDLGVFIEKNGIEKSEGVLAGKNKAEISQFIKPIKGVGPKVIENYLILRNLKD